MIKNINHIIKIFIISFFLCSGANSNEQFNFDINNIEILNQGNFFKGTEGGIVSTNDGLTIEAKTFEYDKIKNILYAYENVEIIDKLNNYKIYTNKIIYFKNEEKIFTEGNSKAYNNDGIIINADKFEYDKFLNILNAKKKVSVFDEIKNYKIFSENITYFKNQQKFYSSGNTSAIIKSKYKFNSTDVNFLINEMELSSIHKSTIKNIKDNSFYEFENFNYLINKNILKAKNISVIANSEVPISQSDKYFFNDGIFDIEKKNFTASQTRVHLEKNIFDRKENDPRLIGVSSKKENDITIVNKGLFTSCKKNEKCPPWHITAKKIKHNKKTKQIIYDNAFLKVYNIPVLYYPKFFHPDPTVERQSGFLRPQLNSSNILGSSASIPYFKVLADNKDLTFMPTIFDSKILKIENEYRQENENSSLIVNYGHVNNYNSALQNNKNSISHLFGKYSKNLNLENFNESDLDISVQKITNDTYLKVFDKYIPDSILKPQNQDTLASKIQINLKHSDYTFFTGADAYENLSGKNSDRYTYVLPYYKFSKNLNYDFIEGYLNFSSNGNNTLKNTNTLSTRVINNLKYNSEDYFSNQGFKTNFNLYLKNLNTVANNDATYKSSPQAQLDSIFEIRTELPLINNSDLYLNTLIPKVSFRINPGKMKNYYNEVKKITVNNIYSIDRIGLDDAFESGQSLTLGFNYRKENKEISSKYFDFELATVIRDKKNDKIPKTSTINNKYSNLFGSASYNFIDNFKLRYNFSLDNNLEAIEYSSVTADFALANFKTKIDFIEENSVIGNTNSIKNETKFDFSENKTLKFNTRRNRKINLTEYYDFVYEYTNDCLVAGLKYRKTYYEDRDLKPAEDLMFTITLYPLTNYEQKIDQNFYK